MNLLLKLNQFTRSVKFHADRLGKHILSCTQATYSGSATFYYIFNNLRGTCYSPHTAASVPMHPMQYMLQKCLLQGFRRHASLQWRVISEISEFRCWIWGLVLSAFYSFVSAGIIYRLRHMHNWQCQKNFEPSSHFKKIILQGKTWENSRVKTNICIAFEWYEIIITGRRTIPIQTMNNELVRGVFSVVSRTQTWYLFTSQQLETPTNYPL